MAASVFTSSKFLLALAAGVSAAAVAGYAIKDRQGRPVIQSLLSGDQVQTQPMPLADTGEVKGEEKQTDMAALSEGAETGEPDAVDGGQAPEPPSFDVLRVERDGSVVVAGRAPGNSDVEIIANGEPLAAGKAGPGGDFAIVFEEPLAPGAHELTIRATPPAEEGKEALTLLSAETGIVTVPETDDAAGEVLAMVQQPGTASRILQKPEPAGETGTGKAADPATEETETAAAADDGVSAAEPVQETAQAGIAPSQDADGVTSVESEPAKQAVVLENSTAGVEAADPQAASLSVEAVDVEPEKVFIAGSGTPGSRVQVYVDNTFRGVATVGPQGGFLFEMPRTLAAGKHDLRVDEVDASGTVKSRVAVVIDHEVEEAVSTAMANEPAATATQSGEQIADSQSGAVAQEPPGTKPAETETATDNQAVAVARAEQADAASAQMTGEMAARPGVEEPVVSQPQPVDDAANMVADSSAQGAAEPARKPEQEPESRIIKTGTSVIIRRGDSLWRISRRMLGQGRKYTLIFEANANVIKDPDIIFPGQVFAVPDQAETASEGEQG